MSNVSGGPYEYTLPPVQPRSKLRVVVKFSRMQNQQLYDKYLQGRHWETHPTLYAERFADFLSTKDFRGSIVDLGCGSGRDVDVFQRRGFAVVGFDYDPIVVSQARNLFPSSTFEVGNTESLTLKPESIGALFMINVIHYVDQQKTFDEMIRVLRPGGYLFVHFNLKITDMLGNVDYKQSRGEILKIITGWRIIEELVLQRHDTVPIPHDHEILEMILQKST